MKRHQAWRVAYRQYRYMRHLSVGDLEGRLHDLVVNYLELTTDRKLGLVPLEEGGRYWIQWFTELLEEFRLRFGDYPAGFRDGLMKGVAIPRPGHPLAERAAAAVAARSTPSVFLAKYGKVEHLGRTLARGEILLRGATFYDDPSLDPARRTNELQVLVKFPGDRVELQVFDGVTNKPKGTLPPPTSITYIKESGTDYYVYCMSSAWKPRLFLDFNADACLFITKPEVFLERLVAGVSERLAGKWDLGHGPVVYFDPLRAHPDKIVVGKMKNFRYAYQREYRVMWFPPQSASQLSSLLLEIGNLEDCSELVTLYVD